MEESTEILQLGGPHLKTCEFCGVEFYGRRNQKYCTTKHKANMNNEKRSSAREQFDPWFQEMIVTYKSILRVYPKRDKDNWVYIGELTKHGFNPDCATKEIKNSEGEVFEYIFGFVFRLSDDKKYVQLFKNK